MVKIRLMRVGMKGQPSYRVVIAEASSPRDGRIIESIGWYDPLTNPSTIKIDGDKARLLQHGEMPAEIAVGERAHLLELAEHQPLGMRHQGG